METQNVNVHPVERRISTALGGVLLLRSIARPSLALGEKALAIALLYRGISGHSYLYQAFGVSTANESNQQRTHTGDDTPEIECSITIEKPANELYRFWREPQYLSQIMGDLAEVTAVSENRAHWVMHGPFNRRMEWDAQVVEDRPGEMLRWKSLDGTQVPNEIVTSFRPAPTDWGTEVTLHFRFDPPGGTLGNTAVKRLSIVPRMLVEKALRRFKSLAETGEMPTLKHNPSARVSSYAH